MFVHHLIAMSINRDINNSLRFSSSNDIFPSGSIDVLESLADKKLRRTQARLRKQLATVA